jgi:gamma-glutamyltranspeptidase/glutathione hydrolase
MRSKPVLVLAMILGLSACAVPPPAPRLAGTAPVRQIVVTANRQASEAALEMLRQGGSAVDAAIAAEAVLGLVEPQASGLLGGTDMLVWTPATGAVENFDGMATAPSAATQAVALDADGEMLDPRRVAFSPRAVGVPGVLPALTAAYRAHGKLPWAKLFEPAFQLAANGAPMPRQLYRLLTLPGAETTLGGLRAIYLGADGQVIGEGQRFRNPDYAAVLRRVAQSGPEGVFAEGGMVALMSELGHSAYPSSITAADLRHASPRIGPAQCMNWQGYKVCTPPAPAAGGFVMQQILGMVAPAGRNDGGFVHRFLEASRLSEADRRRYLADPAFVDVPGHELLDPGYLAQRAALIQPQIAISQPRAGELPQTNAALADPHNPQAGTSTVAVVDASGLSVAMTSTVNLHFGAHVAALGMVFNNALINFAPPPPTTLPELGGHYANEMAPGKRPVSPIAPVIVLGPDNRPILIGGGAGGPQIPDTMAMALIDILTQGLSPQQALAAGHIHAANPDHVVVETGTDAEALRPALEASGHRVESERVDTGNALLLRQGAGWIGAADPRRDGVVLGMPQGTPQGTP